MQTADRLVSARGKINAGKYFLRIYFKVKQTNAGICMLINPWVFPSLVDLLCDEANATGD
jgi:hypothetical protein